MYLVVFTSGKLPPAEQKYVEKEVRHWLSNRCFEDRCSIQGEIETEPPKWVPPTSEIQETKLDHVQ